MIRQQACVPWTMCRVATRQCGLSGGSSQRPWGCPREYHALQDGFCETLTAIQRFCERLGQGEAAYHDWQNSRPGVLRKQSPTAETSWAEFRERFPIVIEYLGDLADTPDWDHRLVGPLGWLVDPRVRHTADLRAWWFQQDNTLSLNQRGIWYFQRLGAIGSATA